MWLGLPLQCVCLVYRKQTPDSERQSRHPVWTDRSRANVAPRMHFTNTWSYHTHTHTHYRDTLNHTAESQVPQEPGKIEKPPRFAGMTSKEQRWCRLAIPHSWADVYSSLMHRCIILFSSPSNQPAVYLESNSPQITAEEVCHLHCVEVVRG